MKKTHAKGHVRKHVKSAHHKHTAHHVKHHPVHHHKGATAHGHTVHAKAKHPAHAKAKALPLDVGDVACCTIEALAASLRCQGLLVADTAVLDLFRAAGGDEDKGIPVRVALEAASEYGLAGYRPVFEEVMPGGSADDCMCWCRCPADLFHRVTRAGQVSAGGLILGADLPGPHAVLATPDGWWSWGELWCPRCDFPDAVVDGAWRIEWAVAA